ncbi:hypothetical protein G3I60_07565 [Streptomyces sp. SID13666]|uniref:hypothetical protein n=1 Tax=unclassified Streptomyces TaxID=2593676 RepID=UPI0013BF34FA|nr:MULTISPECIES: hypothetical protein [unclassified Streptomyces]NEA54015.1 hypothetical protein [Streptomyces sp. SID13666]NEA70843.1 hypothetical protein [Streptomyces sp. SID13588]
MPIDPFVALNAMLRAEVTRAEVTRAEVTRAAAPESEPRQPAAPDTHDAPERPSATHTQSDGA